MGERQKELDKIRLALRPGLGTIGHPLRVRANFFEVTSLPVNNIIHYDVTISPEVPPALNRKVFEEFEKENRGGALAGIRPIFDGRKNIFAPRPLPFGESTAFRVKLPEDKIPTARRTVREFTIKIKKVGEIIMEELYNFLQGRGQLTNNCLTAIMALDVLIGHNPSMLYATKGRSFFIPQDSRPLFGGVEVWQGYYQSARPTTGRMQINIDVSATAFYEGGELITIVVKALNKRSPDDLRRGLDDRDRVKLEKFLKNLKVRVVHRGDAVSMRRYRIRSITPRPANEATFTNSEGEVVDVATYFHQTYHRPLSFPYLPCVVVNKDMFLPMEVCQVIEGQRYMRKLNEKQTADMIKFTCTQPNIRANKIIQGYNILNYRENDHMKQFGMKVSNQMTEVSARVLPVPTVQYHPSSRPSSIQPKEGAWNLRGVKVAVGTTLGSWGVLVFAPKHVISEEKVMHFIKELITTCQETGMNIPNRNPPINHANPLGDIEGSLKTAWLNAGNRAKAQPQLIICILPTTDVQLYGKIKYVSDTIIGVATQCIQQRHMMNPKKQYCANVCLKMNVKLGGMNSFLKPEDIPFISERPTILMGADVTHPAPGTESGKPSIASLCASMDAKASRYAATIRLQRANVEIIANLGDMVKELLKTFYQTCGRKPERILFYRDGVSESQFRQVLYDEMNAVKAACQSLEVGYNPTITFVVVQRRHHVRFFPMEKKDSDRSGNCLPGTTIDDNITHPFEFDFYLQSHPGLQGTSKPTHYYVLYDENSFTSDSLQSLSYNLCYIYARCTRAVSIVPPVYYADLVCARARFHSRDQHLSDTESSEEGTGAPPTYGTVNPDLAK
ncbi:5692_t:CDS:10, partial [Ambispora leptoticha]